MSNGPLSVRGVCPSCGRAETLFLDDGAVTCSSLACERPDAAHEVLADGETAHIIKIRVTDFIVRHPLIERVDGALMLCTVHGDLAALRKPPVPMGTYRVRRTEDGGYEWEPIPDA